MTGFALAKLADYRMTHKSDFKLDDCLLNQQILVCKFLTDVLFNIGLIEELSNVLTENLSSF